MSPPSQQRQLANWITDYVNAVDKISESPQSYHIWSAISVIGAVLKNNVWIDRGLYKIYPNQFIVLVGPPGIGKGNAIHAANEYVRNPPNKVPLAHYIIDQVTTAKIVEILSNGFPRVTFNNGHMLSSKEASCIMQVSELPVLLDNNASMTNFLCEAWSRSDYYYSTKSGGAQVVKDLCLSLIAACVPDFVKDINKAKGFAISNGLTSRMIFVYANERSKTIVWPGKNNNVGISTNLSADLDTISRLSGEFSISLPAKQIFESKYHEIVKQDESDSEVVVNFKSRQAAHIWKVAMTISAAKNDSLVIDDYDMSTAITLVDGVLKTLDVTFGGVGDSCLASQQQRVLNYMVRKGVASRSEILRDNYRHVTQEDLDRILAILVSCNFIQEYTQGGKRLFKHVASTNGAKP